MHKLSDCLYNVFQTNILHGKNLDLEESADKMFLKTIQKRWKCTPKNRSEDGRYGVV